MSNRCNEKRITSASRTIKFLREQSGLSLKATAGKSGVGFSVIAHLETGRILVGPGHLERLLPVYGVTLKTFQMFAEGSIPLPRNLHSECRDLLAAMTEQQIQTVMPVLRSLAGKH